MILNELVDSEHETLKAEKLEVDQKTKEKGCLHKYCSGTNTGRWK